MALSKTADVLRACTSVAASTLAYTADGSEIDVSTYVGGLCQVRFGRGSATAAGAGAVLSVQSSLTASGSDWGTFAQFVTAFGACTSLAVTGTTNAGQAVILMSTTTGIAVGASVFIENPTPANSEWGIVVSVNAGVSITIDRNLDNAQTSSTVRTLAEVYNPVEIPLGVMRLRFVHDNSVFTQASFAQALLTKVAL